MTVLNVVLFFVLLMQDKEYKTVTYGRYNLHFRYEFVADSAIMVGYITDGKNKEGIHSVNIYEIGQSNGTVPHPATRIFRLGLSAKSGIIVFNKPGVFTFRHRYQIK